MRPPNARYSRRRQRDRAAHQAALTLTAVMTLLAVGGAWWLIVPHEAVTSAAARVDPLIVLEPKAIASHVKKVKEVEARVTADEPRTEPVAEPEYQVYAIPTQEPKKPAGPTFNNRPLRKAGTVRMLVTAYSPDARSCGASADNITASGYSVWTNAMKLVAADPRILPYGSIISVPGYDGGRPVPVLDCGGAIKGQRLDVLFPTHEVALQWGKRWVEVTVWKYADR